MLFNSSVFVVFFILVYGLYWAMGKRVQWQNRLLLAASMVFYGWWDVRFLYLFILTTTVDFYCALMIHEGRVSRRQRLVESAVLVGAAFFCLTIRWGAVTIVRNGTHLSGQVDWASLLATGKIGWGVLLASLGLAAAANLVGPWAGSMSEARRRKVFLVASVVSNLTVLGFFKYFNFFAGSLSQLIHAVSGITPGEWTLKIILPVGISFYTFQSLAYTIDVYRKRTEPVGSYLSLATCLSFFPLLVAGPIERPNHFFPQFFRPRSVSGQGFREGLWLMTWGLFKKLVVADNAALIVASVFGPYDKLTAGATVPADGLRILIGTYAFAMQIYGDFSGYSDMARGTARLLGFEIMLNFNLPYFAISPSDFWKRWHISLSSWLRDYLYIPLGGNRGGGWNTYRNLFLTMLLGGLWHGAAWTFVLWGAFHGLILVVYRLVAPGLGEQRAPAPAVAQKPASPAVSRSVVTVYSCLFPLAVPSSLWPRIKSVLFYGFCGLLMFHLTCLGWLLFRAQNITTVRVFLESILLHPNWSPAAAAHFKDLLFYSWFLVVFQVLQAVTGTLNPMSRWNWFVRLNVWLFVLMSLLAFSAKTGQAFIYFAF
jgi:D-alanyl-lipoteichoic acid acyltransferase DltB (MBOAT superfamily)